MENWPTIGVLLPTYDRHNIVAKTVELLRRHLIYSGQIEYFVSEDSGTLPYIIDQDVRVFRGPGRGLGANLNHLIKHCPHKLLMQMDDDHHLLAPLALDQHVELLMTDQKAGWIRLMGIGGHKYRATLKGLYWWVDWDSPEAYITSNRPHLKHRRFHDFFGPYPEGFKLGQTEENFCGHCKHVGEKDKNSPQVLVPLDVLSESGWSHVGDSWQGKGY